jgi:hypothetical protein
MSSTGTALGDQRTEQLAPAQFVLLEVLEVGRLLPVLGVGPLLDQQLDELRVVREEAQERSDGLGQPVERVLDPRNIGVDPLAKPAHDAIGRGQEQVALAGEMAVKGPLADLELLDGGLRDHVGVAVLGEECRGGVEDLIPTRTPVRLNSSSRLPLGHGLHVFHLDAQSDTPDSRGSQVGLISWVGGRAFQASATQPPTPGRSVHLRIDLGRRGAPLPIRPEFGARTPPD